MERWVMGGNFYIQSKLQHLSDLTSYYFNISPISPLMDGRPRDAEKRKKESKCE